MTLLIKNIKGLVQADHTPPMRKEGKEMGHLPVLENAWLLCVHDRIKAFGPMSELPDVEAEDVLDARDRYVMPAFVDSHTHIVFPASRESEFVDKIKGLSYAEIAAKGGGILNSASKMQDASEEELYFSAMKRIREVTGTGTGAIEIKSGYGLSLESELKMLRVARMIKQNSPLQVKTTFLGAHAIPKQYTRRRDYIDLVIREMIPAVAEEKLADYCDVFCEQGFFSESETEEIIQAGLAHGLKPKIHANQLHVSGGVQVGVRNGALSVDHLESMGEAEIEALKGSATMPVTLPGAAFFLRMQYTPARQIIDAGLGLALATDYNPGSAPCGSMPLMIALACVQMRMTPEEAINAATINAAYALEMQDELGTITPGKRANLIITHEIPSLAYIPYAFGSPVVETTILNGHVVYQR